MPRIEKTVFISYRRTNFPWALAIFQDLTQHGYDVFFDYSGLASGDFESVIIENIRARAHFLVLLTPSALDRCVDPDDWLRREIEAATDSRRNIVPLMLEGFDFGNPAIISQLTGKLIALRRYNALSMPAAYFFDAMRRLRDRYLSVRLDAVLHPASVSAQVAAAEQKTAAETAPTVRGEELTAQQWFERGYNAVDVDDELRFYNQAIRLKPDFADAFINRGVARHTKGDIEGAIQDYNEAIRLKSGHISPVNDRTNIRRGKGHLKDAIQDYTEAIRFKPVAKAYYNRGLIRENQDDIEGAIHDFQKYLDNGGGLRYGDQSGVEQTIRTLREKRLKADSATAP